MQPVSITTIVVITISAHELDTKLSVTCAARWFSLVTSISSSNKAYLHEIAKILFKMVLNKRNTNPNPNLITTTTFWISNWQTITNIHEIEIKGKVCFHWNVDNNWKCTLGRRQICYRQGTPIYWSLNLFYVDSFVCFLFRVWENHFISVPKYRFQMLLTSFKVKGIVNNFLHQTFKFSVRMVI